MTAHIATRVRVGQAPKQHGLTAAYLIAAAVNEQGNIDLPAVRDGRTDPESRVEFSLDLSGRLLQRPYWTSMTPIDGSPAMIVIRGDQEEMDMTFFAECLEYTFGRLTPSLFQLAERLTGRPRRFIAADAESGRRRAKVLRDAFNLHVLTSEECGTQHAS